MQYDGNEKHIVAKPIRSQGSREVSNREIWARVCFFYPQYTLQEASKLPRRDINLLLRTAEKIQAERFYELTQITAAPHTKKGQGVKQLTDYFRKKIDE